MKTLMDKYSIIKLKQQGHSNRTVAKMIGINRKTVSKYWNEYLEQTELLSKSDSKIADIQEAMCSKPNYNSSTRKPRKYTIEIDKLLDIILENEKNANY